jgi:hypothetical protein
MERNARRGHGHGIENVIVRFAPTGQRIPAQGANPGNRIREERCVLKEHRIGWAGVDVRDTRLCGVPSERVSVFPGGVPGLAAWAGMQCPVGAWDRKRGGRLAPTEPRRHVGTRCPAANRLSRISARLGSLTPFSTFNFPTRARQGKARQHPRTATFPQSKWPNSRDRFQNSPFPSFLRTAIKRHQTKIYLRKKFNYNPNNLKLVLRSMFRFCHTCSSNCWGYFVPFAAP